MGQADIFDNSTRSEGAELAALGEKLHKIVVIVSSGRTGTKAIAHHLDKCYSNVRAMHEPPPSLRLRRSSIKSFSKRLSKQELIDILYAARRPLIERLDQPIYIESNPMLMGFIEALGEVFHNVHVVHVVRDPRTFVRSSINFGAFRGLKLLMSTFCPYWMPRPEHFPENTARRWFEMSHIERMSWFWNLVNAELNRGETLFGQRYLRIKFEELFAEDGSGLDRLTDWIGLPQSTQMHDAANSERVNASRKQVLKSWEQWDESSQELLLKHCGRLMSTYGYRASRSEAQTNLSTA